MLLRELLSSTKGITLRGSSQCAVSHICSDSRDVVPGSLFIARRGERTDGAAFIPTAIAAGAVAVAVDRSDLPWPWDKVALLIADDLSVLEGALASAFYDHPSHRLFTVGITGTCGKTSTSYFAHHLFEECGMKCGLMGSLETVTGSQNYSSVLTTGEAIFNHKMLAEMEKNGCSAAIMEVSSHALVQGRVSHIDYDVGLFTNLSSEHLDYHKTMEAYASAKGRLFDQVAASGGVSILNRDDPLAFEVCRQKPFLSYGLHDNAELRAHSLSCDHIGMRGVVAYRGTELPFAAPLFGIHNCYNLLAAMAIGLVYGLSLQQLVVAIASLPPIAGRLEPIPNALNLHIYVDHAHKEGAFQMVLEALKPLCSGRLIALFGCGGDRDKTKRPHFAAIAERLADLLIITNDNPRSESPEQIAAEIASGLRSQATPCHIELDRRKAIALALELAKPEDLILIAGKGDERQQLFADHALPFHDKSVVQELCKARARRTV